MTDEREAKMEALRARVKAKKEAALSGGIIEEELVVSTEDLTDAQSIRQQEDDEWYELMDLDADRWRNLAAVLILVGSLSLIHI